MNMNKVIVISLLGLLLVGCVSGFTINYSNPTNQDGSDIIYTNLNLKPETHYCSNEEWNGYFFDYNNGFLDKKETLINLRGCDRW